MDGYNVHLQIWDTAGQERFKSMVSFYLTILSLVKHYGTTELGNY